jgi:GNAT superfamily N-acetyltransferase
LMKESDVELGLAKMGVTESAQGKKIGQHLLRVAIEEAKRRGAKLISLDTAYKLETAIHIYKKFGFVQTSEEVIHGRFGRKTFRMELQL